MKAKIGSFKQCMILYIVFPERVEAIVHIIANHSRKKEFGERPAQYTIDRAKVYPIRCMNRIILLIGYMNAIYALKKLDNNFYPAINPFCIRILCSDICILDHIRLLVPWSGHSKLYCIVLWFTAQRSYYAGADSGLYMYVRGHPPS
jgi:hypothetical protein